MIQVLLLACALLSVATTLGIIAVLITETFRFFQEVSVIDFLTGTKWTPLFEPRQFGILPLLSGTMLVAVGSAIVAIPLGVGSAIFLNEYASDRVRAVLKPALEILAGIPTVVYGYFALTAVTPFLQMLIPQTEVFNAASAAIVVGVMILPMIASL
ncbi:phosphate ABC transporter permease subunit PstC, partial [bacterium]|nr:phosphate ABC transporter permease subunit PstC [bacterium]